MSGSFGFRNRIAILWFDWLLTRCFLTSTDYIENIEFRECRNLQELILYRFPMNPAFVHWDEFASVHTLGNLNSLLNISPMWSIHRSEVQTLNISLMLPILLSN